MGLGAWARRLDLRLGRAEAPGAEAAEGLGAAGRAARAAHAQARLPAPGAAPGEGG